MDTKEKALNEILSSKSIPIKAAAWYAVLTGKNPGIYDNINDARNNVQGFPKGFYRKFDTKEEAEACLDDHNTVVYFKSPNRYNVLKEQWI